MHEDSLTSEHRSREQRAAAAGGVSCVRGMGVSHFQVEDAPEGERVSASGFGREVSDVQVEDARRLRRGRQGDADSLRRNTVRVQRTVGSGRAPGQVRLGAEGTAGPISTLPLHMPLF